MLPEREGVRYIIRHIPFYETDKVVTICKGGRLRGRGSRTGFVNPVSPYGYKYYPASLAQSLPAHLATEFTLYTPYNTWATDVYFNFKGYTQDGKIRLRYLHNAKHGIRRTD